MSISNVGGRNSVIKLDFHADEEGSYQAGSGGTIQARTGDEIRLAFLAPSGRGPANLDVTVQGDSVMFEKVLDSVRMAGSHTMIGESELDAVLTARRLGQSTVVVKLLDMNDQPKETLAFTVTVA